MKNQEYMLVDGIPVPIDGEKNLLELIRKTGVDLPTFCYHSELSIYGACRMCMVEDERGRLSAACSTPPKAGMDIRTNTPRLRKYRRNILELILADHCRDCTTCQNSENCRLQDLAKRFGIHTIRFENRTEEPEKDWSSPCIIRDPGKCILCGDCVRECNEVQNVGAIDFAFRGSKATIDTCFNRPIAETDCVGCGRCAAGCPTGAIVIKDERTKVWDALSDPNVYVTCEIAPAVRVAIGEEFGLPSGVNAIGKTTAALHHMGFNQVYDTSIGADMTVIEESNEFLNRVAKGENLPLFTSCCPAWVQYAEKKYPEFLPNVSSCRSPMQMFASVLKAQNREELDRKGMKHFHVAIMPCTAKKFESKRPEFTVDGEPNTDIVLTTQELIWMIRESGIVFDEIDAEAMDMPFGSYSGAAVIFGVTGGVTEAVLRTVLQAESKADIMKIAFTGVRGMAGVKEAEIVYQDKGLKIAVVSGLGNASRLLDAIKAGEVYYDLVEVMACPGGCVSGAGQPYRSRKFREMRGDGLYQVDQTSIIKSSHKNPLMDDLYEGILKGRSHELLHVDYIKKDKK